MSLHKVIISGGGTGGHIFPAIAIADELRKRIPDIEILFVGAEGRMEMEKVPQAGYNIVGLKIAGFQRSLSLKNLSFPFKVLASLLKAKKLVREFKPQVAIGVGGYASGPLLRAAQSIHVPTLIQEQNSYPGITNKLLAKKAQCICVAYDGLSKFFAKDKLVETGNPVRASILGVGDLNVENARAFFALPSSAPVVLVVGGSLGARSINNALLKNYTQLIDAGVHVLWQTGAVFYEQHRATLALLPEQLKVVPFIKEMDMAYAAASCVISRAGALAISELCLVAKPCILVPSPYVSEDHQRKNAMALVNKQAALMVLESDTETDLVKRALALLANTSEQEALKTNIAALAKPNATAAIVDEIIKLVV